MGTGRLVPRIIEKWDEVHSLGTEWNDLLGKSRAATIFLTWEWVSSWAQVIGTSVRPFVIEVRDEKQRLVGLAPFYFNEYRFVKWIPYRVLRVMADNETGSEYPNWIAVQDKEEQVIETIIKTLSQSRRKWDCIWMPNMAGWNNGVEMILKAFKSVKFFCHLRSMGFSCFNLPENMDSYIGRLTKGRRQNLRTEINRVLRQKKCTLEKCEDVSQVPLYLDALFDLHHRRWSKKGDEGTFRRKPREAVFYREFAPVALRRGWLRLFGLRDENGFKAIQIGYVYNNVFHALQEGFDPEYLHGVGNVLRYKVIEEAIAEGLEAYDFLGGVSEHKRDWLAEERTGYDLFVGHRGLKNVVLFAKEIWPTGRYFCRTVTSQN